MGRPKASAGLCTVELLALAVQLPAVRTRTDPAEAADAALAAARVWYTNLEGKNQPSRETPRGQASGKRRGPQAKQGG